MKGELEQGHTYEYSSAASVNAGIQLNRFDVKIYNEKKEDITSHYYIEKKYGMVTVARARITIKASDAAKVYDGTPLTSNEYQLTEGALIAGDQIVICIVTGEQTEIGRSDNVVTQITILDTRRQDVTDNYEIVLESGKLRVTAP